MKSYQTKAKKLAGARYADIYQKAFSSYKQIKKKSKRRPYIRSAYFKKDKIFLALFWQHLRDKKNLRDKTRRLKYFPCAIELVRHSRFEPSSKENVDKRSEILHRFAGVTADDDLFFVQVKEDKRTGKKWLMSVFPLGK